MSDARRGTVVEFDEHVGLGVVESDAGERFPFHCIELADGSRSVAVDAVVTFRLLCKFGRYEAAAITS